MAILSANYSAFLHRNIPILPSKFQEHCANRVGNHKALSLASRTIFPTEVKYSYRSHFSSKMVVSAARNDHRLSFDDELAQEPFWLSIIKETIWGVRSLFEFLVEQPSQLKYIEWPSFSNTLRTATLTLVLVALLIVALSSVDSVLCYLLALVLRKPS